MENKYNSNTNSGANEEEPRMFVGGLFPETTSDTLRNYFSTYGKVKEVKIIGEKQKRSRGFGFVLFESMETFHKVIRAKHVIDGREVDCNSAVYSNQTKDTPALKNEKKIFIKKVPVEIGKQDLIDFFSGFGDIDKVLLVKRKNKEHAFSFVEFHDKKAAKKIAQQKEFYIKGKYRVDCEMAQPKIRNYLNKVNMESSEPEEGRASYNKESKKGSKGRHSKNNSKRNSKKNSRENSAQGRQRNEISVSNIVKGNINPHKNDSSERANFNLQNIKTGKDTRISGFNPHFTPPSLFNNQFNPSPNITNIPNQYPINPSLYNNVSQNQFNQYPQYSYPQSKKNEHYPLHNSPPPSDIQYQYYQNYDPQQPQRNTNEARRNDNGPRFIHSGSGSISFKSNSSKCSLTKKIISNPPPKVNKNDENLRFNKSNSSRNSNQSNQDTFEEENQNNSQPRNYLHPEYTAPPDHQPGSNMFSSLGPQLTQPQIIRDLKRQPTQPQVKDNYLNRYDPDMIMEEDVNVPINPNMLDSNITPKLNEVIRPYPNVIYSEKNSPFVSTLSGDSLGRMPAGKKAYSARIYTHKEKREKIDFEGEYHDEEDEEEENQEEGEEEEEERDLISITLKYQRDKNYGKLRSLDDD